MIESVLRFWRGTLLWRASMAFRRDNSMADNQRRGACLHGATIVELGVGYGIGIWIVGKILRGAAGP